MTGIIFDATDENIRKAAERLKEGGDVSTLTPTKVTPVTASEPDSIEEALSKLESKQFTS